MPGMAQITIRCHPRIPVPSEEIEDWLEREVEHLRDAIPQGAVRLSSLTQRPPGGDIDVGWLIDLELPEDGGSFVGRDLALAIRDMQLLGLQPTVLRRDAEYGDQGRMPAAAAGNGGQDPSTNPPGQPIIVQ
jgi:hypothetical protein